MAAPYFKPGSARKNMKTRKITYEDGSSEDVTEDEYLKRTAANKEFNDRNPGVSDTTDRSHPKVAGGRLKPAGSGK